ncbi:Myosin-7 [Bienertia sinuspersici]
MEKQFQETKSLLMKEREEAVKKAAEQVPNVQEVPVLDDELMSKLTVENEQLKEAVCSLENKIDEAEKKLEETSKLDQAPVNDYELINKLAAENEQFKLIIDSTKKKNDETEKKFEEMNKLNQVPASDNELINKLVAENEQLKELVSSLEKKIDESEKKLEEMSKLNEVPCSDNELGIISSLEKKIDETEKTCAETSNRSVEFASDNELINKLTVENEQLRYSLASQGTISSLEQKNDETVKKFEEASKLSEERLKQEFPSGTPRKAFGTESLRKSQMERQRELADSLIKWVAGDVGFSQGKPVAASTIYKCLLHWKSFEADRTNVFDRLTELISSAFQNSDKNNHLAYWLSNTSTLLFLLQRSFKGSKDWKPPQPPTFFGRMAQGFRSSPSSANIQVDIVRSVEAKQPALLFKQQLTAYVH